MLPGSAPGPDDGLRFRATSQELAAAGVNLSEATNPDRRDHDPLARFKVVPNHAMFLLTSEDAVLEQYIRDHWSALDGMSADVCDIHVPLTQLRGESDAYSQLDDLQGILGLGTLRPTDLPALHIWSSEASVRVPLSSYRTEDSLRDALRLVFTTLADIGRPLSQPDALGLVRSVEAMRVTQSPGGQAVAHAKVGGSIVQITQNNFYDRERAPMSESDPSKSTQSAEDVRLAGDLTQSSDASDAEQLVKGVAAGKLEQSVAGKKDRLSVGPYTAYGKWAVVGLVLVVVTIVVIKALLN